VAQLNWLLPLAATAAALTLAVWTLARAWSGFHRALAAVLLLTAAVEGADALFLADATQALLWRRVALSAELVRMAVLFLLASTLIGLTSAEPDPRAQRRGVVAGVAAAAALAMLWWGTTLPPPASATGDFVILGPLGRLAYLVLLPGLVLALAELESVLRASRAPDRYRVKFVLVGVGALAGFEIYVSSETLLTGGWRTHHAVVGGMVALVSVGLIGFGLGRARLATTLGRVSVSPQMVYSSFTLLLVGLYLVAAGLLGELLRLAGRPVSVGLAELVVFLLVVALVAGVSSRAARARFRLFVSRHFLRSRYDYRTQWLEVTAAFGSAQSIEDILDRLLDLLAQTFGAPRLSIWMIYEADDRFHQVRSTNIETAPPPLSREHPVVVALDQTEGPVELGGLAPTAKGEADVFLDATKAVLGVPIRGAGELLAFIVLSPGPAGGGYDDDDRDLLRAIAHHVGVLFAHARLAEERHAAAELDALSRLAAFCLHDLKNLTGRLSLVAQNAAKHGDDPTFRESAMGTVQRTAVEMGDLIGRLSRRSPALGRVGAVDVEELVESTLTSLGPDFGVRFQRAGEAVPPVPAVREQLQQVLLNLLLNAREAVTSSSKGSAAVEVCVRQKGDRVLVEVADHGPGVPPDRLRTLFQPFQSATPGGFGIGLYESKRIVESYGGRLRVDSAPGRGTRVLIELPSIPAGAGMEGP
jgi:putative PEP-CTERM system histidine kinase